MSTARPQAIAGVSSEHESDLRVTYPSIAAGPLGRALGRLYESIPLRIGTIKLSYLLFPLPLAPLTLLMYLWKKAFGSTYAVTNRSVKRWGMLLGTRSHLQGSADLANVAEVVVDVRKGQEFFKSGDVTLFAADGTRVLELPGVVRPYVFRQTILAARDARRQTDAALEVIRARQQ